MYLVSTDSEEFLGKLCGLTDFVLRSEPDRDHITGLHVSCDELKALVWGNPPSAESLGQDERLGCVSDNIDPFSHLTS